MPGAKFRAIIFDIGRVLVSLDVSWAVAGLAECTTLSPADIWSAITNDPLWTDWQEGRISPRDWHLHLTKRLGGSLTFEQFTAVWNRAIDPAPILESGLFERLSKRYRLALLSNTDPIHVAHLESTYGFFRHFPRPARIYSCVVGASKPNPLIYREALRASKARAEEAVYIDDIPSYVQAAKRLGMTGITFQSPEQLKSDLQVLGINTR
ncbi:MAG TPA: HAD family phosphatase [Candidatus Acidoferrum sp.]|nr:HAD family phosphatase [Candidatus Acidoferrum sp.]